MSPGRVKSGLSLGIFTEKKPGRALCFFSVTNTQGRGRRPKGASEAETAEGDVAHRGAGGDGRSTFGQFDQSFGPAEARDAA